MATYQLVAMAGLEDPANPQRQETLMERIEELIASIKDNGLQHPIGVRDLGDGRYQIIYGHRRSIACAYLGWTEIPAMVYLPGEGDDDTLMGAENYHRNATNAKEEALYYQRVLASYPEGTIGMARALNIPQQRIETLLTLCEGNEQVFNLVGEGRLSVAQAVEINKFESMGYRLQAIERCLVDGLAANRLRQWRQEIKRLGMDDNAKAAEVAWNAEKPEAAKEPQQICQVRNHVVPLTDSMHYIICNPCWNMFLHGLESAQREELLKGTNLWDRYQELLRLAHGVTMGIEIQGG